jgi:hypothetical protein
MVSSKPQLGNSGLIIGSDQRKKGRRNERDR